MLYVKQSKPYPAAIHSCHKRFNQLLSGKSTDQINQLMDEIELIANKFSRSEEYDESQLSEREKEVLILVANGYTRRDVGTVLNISPNTAAKHIANIYKKLGIASVAEATKFALNSRMLK